MSKTDEMRQIKDEVLNLKTSPLYKYRTDNKYFPVIGEGSHDAEIMFVGEAPGKTEATTGRPFCGAAGKVLDQLLGHIGLDRKSVYITNIVKDRPPGNRDPLPDEIEVYSKFLDRQVEIIQPKIIATLGRHSMKYIMGKFGLSNQLKSISQCHGLSYGAKTNYGDIKIATLYHPAVGVYNNHQIPMLKKDFEILKHM